MNKTIRQEIVEQARILGVKDVPAFERKVGALLERYKYEILEESALKYYHVNPADEEIKEYKRAIELSVANEVAKRDDVRQLRIQVHQQMRAWEPEHKLKTGPRTSFVLPYETPIGIPTHFVRQFLSKLTGDSSREGVGTFNLAYFEPTSGEDLRIQTAETAFTSHLAKVATSLAKSFRWTGHQATTFILCGYPPESSLFDIGFEECEIPCLSRIILRVDPFAKEKEIKELYGFARDLIVVEQGQRARRFTRASLTSVLSGEGLRAFDGLRLGDVLEREQIVDFKASVQGKTKDELQNYMRKLAYPKYRSLESHVADGQRSSRQRETTERYSLLVDAAMKSMGTSVEEETRLCFVNLQVRPEVWLSAGAQAWQIDQWPAAAAMTHEALATDRPSLLLEAVKLVPMYVVTDAENWIEEARAFLDVIDPANGSRPAHLERIAETVTKTLVSASAEVPDDGRSSYEAILRLLPVSMQSGCFPGELE